MDDDEITSRTDAPRFLVPGDFPRELCGAVGDAKPTSGGGIVHCLLRRDGYAAETGDREAVEILLGVR